MKIFYAAIFIVFSLSNCSKDSHFKKYSTYQDAAKDESIEKGWIPEFLPHDSINIYESHDVDANQIAVKFSSESTTLLPPLNKVDKNLHQEAFQIINSQKFPGMPKNLSSYYLRCGQEGAGLLATDDRGTFYYIEPAGGKWKAACAIN